MSKKMRWTPPPAPVPALEDVIYYEHVTWKGVREVCRCALCGTCRDDEDAMIEHVLIHYPVDQHEKIFETMLRRKNEPASAASRNDHKEQA